MIYGYARVSTDGQSVDTQVKQLRAAGTGKVYRETASGAKTERVQLRRVLRRPRRAHDHPPRPARALDATF